MIILNVINTYFNYLKKTSHYYINIGGDALEHWVKLSDTTYLRLDIIGPRKAA